MTGGCDEGRDPAISTGSWVVWGRPCNKCWISEKHGIKPFELTILIFLFLLEICAVIVVV
jgi:hypothetical protein